MQAFFAELPFTPPLFSTTKILPALLALTLMTGAASAQQPTARADGLSSEEIKEFASDYMKRGLENKMSDRKIANNLASEIIWLEKIQLVCPSYYHVNALRLRYEYLLRQGTWAMMFGPGKTSTSIMNEASAKRNQEFNDTLSKKDWCEDTKAFGIQRFGWGPIFEADQ